jgi:hypothetical protein
MAEADPNYPPSAMFPAGDAYGLYLYQTWAAAAATGGKAPPPMHPAAAWANHYAQSIKVIISKNTSFLLCFNCSLVAGG